MAKSAKNNRREVRNVFFNTDLFSFCKLPKFYFQHPKYEPGKKQILTLGMREILENDYMTEHGILLSELCLHFLETVVKDFTGENHPAYSNLFSLVYDNDELVFFGTPLFCQIKKEVCLLFGTEFSNSISKFNLEPLVYKEVGTFLPNDRELSVSFYETLDFSADDPNNAPKLRRPIFIIPNDFKENLTLIYNIKVNVSEGTTPYELEQCFKIKPVEERKAELLNLVTPLYGFSASISYIFSQLFATKTFPSDGMLLKIVDVKEVSSSYGSSYMLKLDTSELPAFSVLADEKEGDKTVRVKVALNEISSLWVNSSHNAGKALKKKLVAMPTPKQPLLLHVKGPNKNGNPCQVPNHDLYDHTFIPPKILELSDAMKSPRYLVNGSVARLKEEEELRTLPAL